MPKPNIKASLDYAERLAQAKDMAEGLKLHADYIQNRMKALAEQASEIGQAVSRAAMDATELK